MAAIDVSDKPLEQLFSLNGRVAVVTGGAKGIGAAICKRLAEAGATVVVADVDTQGAETTVETISQSGGQAIAYTVDVKSSQAIAALADEAVNQFGRLDIWVNDAGIQPLQAEDEVTDEEWQQMLDTNLSGTFYGARAAHKQMRTQGRGVIINIASSVGYHGVKQQPHYVAVKWGVRGLTSALAMDWSSDNIRVLAIAPGLTDTPGVAAKKEGLDAIAGGDIHQVTAKAYPSGRMGLPDDIARAVVFAASDLAIFMTGSTLLVDGGEIAAGGAG
jgi:NAD(P)-dependent dehydrogenase (short-subunit alcohol dehydrogenase family)